MTEEIEKHQNLKLLQSQQIRGPLFAGTEGVSDFD